jgi:hypothetical protein
MGLDIRLPIGLMFTLLGALLAGYGLFTQTSPDLYQPSLGVDINLWWGGVLFLFGLVMLIPALIHRRTSAEPKN